MNTSYLRNSITIALSVLLALPVSVQANPGRGSDARQEYRADDRQDDRRDDRHDDRKFDLRDDRQDDRRYDRRSHKNLVIIAPRHRAIRNVVVVRNYGHSYYGYGHHAQDNDALKWLAFTAITLKILDNVNEQAQREHEAAQIRATTAQVGEKIYWETDSANGYVVTSKEGRNASGLTCREFQQSITVGGNTEQAYGTACLQSDGAWKIIS